MRLLEEMDRTGLKLIVVTSNPCPEHMEDLRDLEPAALLAGEFFLRQDFAAALAEVLDRISAGEHCYQYTPGPRSRLSAEERAVLKYAVRGWDNGRIAEQLGIENQTVRNRLCSAYKALGIHSRAQAVLYYWHAWQPAD
jgi:DNA-binding NarL/FixJ family response regulator